MNYFSHPLFAYRYLLHTATHMHGKHFTAETLRILVTGCELSDATSAQLLRLFSCSCYFTCNFAQNQKEFYANKKEDRHMGKKSAFRGKELYALILLSLMNLFLFKIRTSWRNRRGSCVSLLTYSAT